MTNNSDINNVVLREKEFHENYYKEAYRVQAVFNFQVPLVWMEKSKNPDSRPLDYWEYSFYLLGNLKGKKVVEIGCGDGWITTCLSNAGAKVFAIDISFNGCKLTREKLNAHGLSLGLAAVMDANSMAFRHCAFDAIFLSGVLHHMDIASVSGEFHRILKKGGIVVCCEPLKYGPFMWTIRKVWLKWNQLKEYVATEDEEPLEEKDLDPFKNTFRTTYIRKFNFIAKTNRLRNRFGNLANFLRWVDYGLLSIFPFLQRYCTCIVCRFEK